MPPAYNKAAAENFILWAIIRWSNRPGPREALFDSDYIDSVRAEYDDVMAYILSL